MKRNDLIFVNTNGVYKNNYFFNCHTMKVEKWIPKLFYVRSSQFTNENNDILIGEMKGPIVLYDWKLKTKYNTFTKHVDKVYKIENVDGNHFVSISRDKTALIWSKLRPTKPKKFIGTQNPIHTCAIDSTTKTSPILWVGDRGILSSIYIFDIKKRELLMYETYNSIFPLDMLYIPKYKCMFVPSFYGSIYLFDLITYKVAFNIHTAFHSYDRIGCIHNFFGHNVIIGNYNYRYGPCIDIFDIRKMNKSKHKIITRIHDRNISSISRFSKRNFVYHTNHVFGMLDMVSYKEKFKFYSSKRIQHISCLNKNINEPKDRYLCERIKYLNTFDYNIKILSIKKNVYLFKYFICSNR